MRLWAHEALRLFQDRLVEDSERQWTEENIDNFAMRFFPGICFKLYVISCKKKLNLKHTLIIIFLFRHQQGTSFGSSYSIQ